jgi:integrase
MRNARRPLTQKLVNTVIPVRRTYISDLKIKGLSLDLVPPRTLTYVFRYRENGRQKSIRIGSARILTLIEARARAFEMRRLVDLGTGLTPVCAPLKDSLIYKVYISQNYLPYAQRKHRGVAVELSYFKNHLLPAFGATLLVDLRKADVLSWVQSLEMKGLKPGSINRALNLFKSTLSKAIEWDIGGLIVHPARGVKTIPDHNRTERYLTREEAHCLMDAVQKSSNPMLYPLIGFLLLTGSRKSEAFNVRWEHIDVAKRLWTVPLSKSGKPRHIPLSAGAMAMVERARQFVASTSLSTSPFVFPNVATGGPLRNIQHCWEQARELAGLQSVRLHDLRHSYASALVNEGRSIYEVQKLLGHANVSTTERYAHLSQETLAQGAAAVQEHYKFK